MTHTYRVIGIEPQSVTLERVIRSSVKRDVWYTAEYSYTHLAVSNEMATELAASFGKIVEITINHTGEK